MLNCKEYLWYDYIMFSRNFFLISVIFPLIGLVKSGEINNSNPPDAGIKSFDTSLFQAVVDTMDGMTGSTKGLWILFDSVPIKKPVLAVRSCISNELSDSLSQSILLLFHLQNEKPKNFLGEEDIIYEKNVFYYDSTGLTEKIIKNYSFSNAKKISPEFKGFLSVQKPFYNPSKTFAVIGAGYIRGPLDGAGYVFILRSENSRWKVICKSLVWVS